MSEGLFRSRLVAVLAGLAALSAIATIAVVALGPKLLGPRSNGASSFSRSAVGYRGTLAYLDASGLTVGRAQDGRLPRVGPDSALVITEPQPATKLAELQSEDWDALDTILFEATEHGASAVVVLPKWFGQPVAGRSDLVQDAVRLPLNRVQAVARAVLEPIDGPMQVFQLGEDLNGVATSASGKTFWMSIRQPHFLPPDDRWRPLLSIRQGHLAAAFTAEEGGPPVVVIADPDLLNNHGLDDGDHAAAVLDLFRNGLGVDTVVFDETLHGFEDSGALLRDAFSFPALLVTAHLALAIGVALWAGARRFGPPRSERPPRTLGREAFIDSTVRLLSGTKDEVASLSAYWKLAQEVVSVELRLPPLTPPERLSRLAAASAERRADDPRSIDAEISTAIQFETDPKRWVELAQRAHRWRMEMTGGLRSAS